MMREGGKKEVLTGQESGRGCVVMSLKTTAVRSFHPGESEISELKRKEKENSSSNAAILPFP